MSTFAVPKTFTSEMAKVTTNASRTSTAYPFGRGDFMKMSIIESTVQVVGQEVGVHVGFDHRVEESELV